MTDSEKKMEVKFPESLHGGVYANNMVISHTREEFIMDFLMVAAPAGSVTSRVIVSPGHVKRIVAALNDNIAKYESTFGPIQWAEEPKPEIGFH